MSFCDGVPHRLGFCAARIFAGGVCPQQDSFQIDCCIADGRIIADDYTYMPISDPAKEARPVDENTVPPRLELGPRRREADLPGPARPRGHQPEAAGRGLRGGRWYHVLALCDGGRIGKVVEFVEASIDLAAVATGAGDELVLGRGFEPHSCLDHVLQDLRRFPGEARALIEAGLKSPVVRNRNFAVAALAAWARGEWPGGLEESLEWPAACEPNEDVRERMRKALRGELLSP
jgi:hypothetical protein